MPAAVILYLLSKKESIDEKSYDEVLTLREQALAEGMLSKDREMSRIRHQEGKAPYVLTKLALPKEYVAAERGVKTYALKDHLGNVRVTVSDRKLSDLTDEIPSNFRAEVLSIARYDAFGSLQQGRQYAQKSYRYGYNGMEKDEELKGAGNSYDYGARFYDPRLGRWLSTDPKAGAFPAHSPYNFALNNPVAFNDPDGQAPRVCTPEQTAAYNKMAGTKTLTAEQCGAYHERVANGTLHTARVASPMDRVVANEAIRKDLLYEGTVATAQWLPVTGGAITGTEITTGKDMLTGETLSGGTRAAMAGMVFLPRPVARLLSWAGRGIKRGAQAGVRKVREWMERRRNRGRELPGPQAAQALPPARTAMQTAIENGIEGDKNILNMSTYAEQGLNSPESKRIGYAAIRGGEYADLPARESDLSLWRSGFRESGVLPPANIPSVNLATRLLDTNTNRSLIVIGYYRGTLTTLNIQRTGFSMRDREYYFHYIVNNGNIQQATVGGGGKVSELEKMVSEMNIFYMISSPVR